MTLITTPYSGLIEAGMAKVPDPEPALLVVITPSSKLVPFAFVKSTTTSSPDLKSLSVTISEEPTAPEEALKDTLCAFTNGVAITAKVNTLRKSTASITLLNLFFMLMILFCKWAMLLPFAYFLFKICRFFTKTGEKTH